MNASSILRSRLSGAVDGLFRLHLSEQYLTAAADVFAEFERLEPEMCQSSKKCHMALSGKEDLGGERE